MLRIIYKGNFTPGPFHLGALSMPILLMACMSIAFNIVSNRLTAPPLSRATLCNPRITLTHMVAASDRRCLAGVLLKGGLLFVIAYLVSDMSVKQAICVLPTQFPINASNLNWAPITAALVIMVALAAWFFPVIGAGAWYQGKAHTLRDANVVGTFQPGIRMTTHTSH